MGHSPCHITFYKLTKVTKLPQALIEYEIKYDLYKTPSKNLKNLKFGFWGFKVFKKTFT